VQLGCGGPEWGCGASWNEAIHSPTENSQTRNRTPLRLTERVVLSAALVIATVADRTLPGAAVPEMAS
jgi:hypothetical protein